MADVGEWAEKEWAKSAAALEDACPHDVFLAGYAAAVESLDKLYAELRRRMKVAQ